MRGRGFFLLLIFVLSGLVIGGLLGNLASKIDFLWWLGYGESFGLTSPLKLDLDIIKLTFAVSFKINVASIIGLIIATYIYKKI